MKIMKTTILTILTAALFCGVATQPLFAGVTYFAISPDLRDDDTKKEVKLRVGNYVIKHMKPGDRAVVLDAVSMKRIASFAIPSHRAYRSNPKERWKKNKGHFLLFRKWVDAKRTPLENPYSMDIPRIFKFCASSLGLKGGRDKLVLVGSVIHDPAEKAYSMCGANGEWLVPADANLASDNVYGLGGAGNLMSGVEVSWVTLGSSVLHKKYAEKVKRWWVLYCRQREAKLVSYDDVFWAAFDNLPKNGRPALGQQYRADTDNSKSEMVTHRSNKRMSGAPVSPDNGNFFMQTNVLAKEGLSGATVKELSVGLKWQAEVDLDIHVRRKPSDKWIFFGYARAPYGKHRKDYLSAPLVHSNSLETVDLYGDMDVRQLEVAVNFYSGKAGADGVKGVVRIFVKGKTYEAPFHIKASSGNKGVGRNKRASSKHWAVFDPVKIVKLAQ